MVTSRELSLLTGSASDEGDAKFSGIIEENHLPCRGRWENFLIIVASGNLRWKRCTLGFFGFYSTVWMYFVVEGVGLWIFLDHKLLIASYSSCFNRNGFFSPIDCFEFRWFIFPMPGNLSFQFSIPLANHLESPIKENIRHIKPQNRSFSLVFRHLRLTYLLIKMWKRHSWFFLQRVHVNHKAHTVFEVSAVV